MKILIICSKAFYKDIAPIKEKLEEMGHIVELPNSYYESDAEKKSWDLGQKEHAEFKARMFRMSEERIAEMDAVLTLNFDNIDPIFSISEKSKNAILRHLLRQLKVDDNNKVYFDGDADLTHGLAFPAKLNLLKLLQQPVVI